MAKKYYPFTKWRDAYSHGLTQYTPENCDNAQKIFDDLISGLAKLGENAGEANKISLFKKAIIATNILDSLNHFNLIETEEREELCELTNQITIACGLNPDDYGNGEGLASEWREW